MVSGRQLQWPTDVLPGGEDDPEGHGKQDDEPGEDEYVPEAHGKQDKSFEFLYLPATQAAQLIQPSHWASPWRY